MYQRPLLGSFSCLLGGVPGGDIFPSFSSSSLLRKGKKRIKGGHYGQGAGFGGPRFHMLRERLVRRAELPNSNLAGSYQLQSSARQWNQKRPGLFVYFFLSFLAEGRQNKASALPASSLLSSSSPSLPYKPDD